MFRLRTNYIRAAIGRLLTVLAAVSAGGSIATTFAAEPARATVFNPPDDTLYAQGRYVYQRNCLTCHGARGDGRGDMAEGMFPKPRPFASGIFKYRSTPIGFLPTDADLARTVRNGISGTSMPAFANLSDREIRVVTEYIKFFSPKWRHPENHAAPITIPPEPRWFADTATRRERAVAGRTLFNTSCAPCHGERGDGKGPSAAALVDEWGQPSVPADLRQPAIRSGPAFADLYRAVVTGIAGTPMPSFAEGFTDEQRWEIIAYIATLREKTAEAEKADTNRSP